MTNKEPVPAKLQDLINGLIKLKKEHNLPNDLPVLIRLGHKEGTTKFLTVPLITVDIPENKEYISVGSQAPLDEIVKHVKIFDNPEGEA